MIVSVSGQMLVGFGMALLLNRAFPYKGLVTTLLLLADDAVGGGGRALLAAYSTIHPGARSTTPSAWAISPGCPIPNIALYAIAITDIWMWAPFVMLLPLPVCRRCPQHLYEAAAIDRAGTWYSFTRITLPLVMPLLLIALIFRHHGRVQVALRHRLYHEHATRRRN